MKFRRIVLVALIVVLVGLGAMLGSAYLLARGAPAWYRLQGKAEAAAAATLENKLIVYYDRMAAAQAWRVRHQAATTESSTRRFSSTAEAAAAVTKDPTLDPFEIQFTDAELNAFFDKWASAGGRRDAMDQYVSDPRILIQQGKLILAATVRDMGTVVSVEMEPRLDEAGQLELNLGRAYAGMLPLPQAVLASRKGQIERVLRRKLVGYQASARFTADGVANGAAAAAGINELLLCALAKQPAEAVLFLPYDLAHPGRSVPVKMEAISLGEGSITMRVREMDAAERARLFERLEKPIVGGGVESEASDDR